MGCSAATNVPAECTAFYPYSLFISLTQNYMLMIIDPNLVCKIRILMCSLHDWVYWLYCIIVYFISNEPIWKSEWEVGGQNIVEVIDSGAKHYYCWGWPSPELLISYIAHLVFYDLSWLVLASLSGCKEGCLCLDRLCWQVVWTLDECISKSGGGGCPNLFWWFNLFSAESSNHIGVKLYG